MAASRPNPELQPVISTTATGASGSRYGRGDGVFAGQLWRGPILPVFLALSARFTGPRSMQVVAHADPQAAKALRFEFDRIAVHERVQAAMVGAGRQDVTRLER